MSAIFGLVRFDGLPVDPAQLARMAAASASWGPDGQATCLAGSAGLGSLRLATTPEAVHERQPRQLPNKAWFTSAARLDNRADLCRALDVPPAEQSDVADGDLIERAYLRWGEACVERLLGDWSFAVWDASARRLFLARDPYGSTALFYHHDARGLAFATSRKALLALDPALAEIDDLFVAQVLLVWPIYHGDRTGHARLLRLPPAHTLTATPQGLTTRLYWRMEDAPLLPIYSLAEAVEGLRVVLDEAVRCRLRSRGPVATMLSGGLDLGAITATAASLLAGTDQPLRAYTAVPLFPPDAFIRQANRFGDEWPLASATASLAAATARQVMQSNDTLEHLPIRSEGVSVLDAIALSLSLHDEPQHAAGNSYWLTSLVRQARADGATVLLNGQGGNAGLSWTGFRSSWPRAAWGRLTPAAQEAAPSWRQRLMRVLPRPWAVAIRVRRARQSEAWLAGTALNPDLARRLDVVGRSAAQFDLPAHDQSPLAARWRALKPGRSILGSLAAELGAAQGIELRDPTSDVRLLSFCLGLPDQLFTDPASGLDRMVIRAAMVGRLPDEVRLNRRRGRQGADLVARLRAERGAVEASLDQLEHSPAAAYLSLPAMRAAWANALSQDTPNALAGAGSVLARGLMAGMFVNNNQSDRSL